MCTKWPLTNTLSTFKESLKHIKKSAQQSHRKVYTIVAIWLYDRVHCTRTFKYIKANYYSQTLSSRFFKINRAVYKENWYTVHN